MTPRETPAKQAVTYSRHAHAAHYGYRLADGRVLGHDIERWDVSPASWSDPRPTCVPAGAERHSGYSSRDEGGVAVQHVVWVRRADLSPGRCSRCPSIDPVSPTNDEAGQ